MWDFNGLLSVLAMVGESGGVLFSPYMVCLFTVPLYNNDDVPMISACYVSCTVTILIFH